MIKAAGLLALGSVAAAATVYPEPALPVEWQDSAANADDNVTFSLSVKQPPAGLEKIKEHALRASTPKDAMYGKFLTSKQIAALSKPAEPDMKAVKTWATSAGCEVSNVREMVTMTCSKSQAEGLLNTQIRTVANGATNQVAQRAGAYTLPEHVDAAVEATYGLHGLPLPPRATRPTLAAAVAAEVTPDVLRTTYNVGDTIGSSSTKNRQAVAEFQGQTTDPKDLAQFFSQYVPSATGKGDDTVYKFQGDPGAGFEGVEAALDIQYIMGIAPKILTEFWYQKSSDFCGDLKVWSNDILSDDDAPHVHSVSYGWQGVLSQIGCTDANVKDVDANFAKLAAKGVTIIFASGDSGSGYKPGSSPVTMYPSWPASSPWVTAVGATRFVDQKVGQPEMASDSFGSGGGFSTMFDAFDAQKTATSGYLANAPNLPPSTSYPAGGRGSADISALGEGYQVVVNGKVKAVAGTSASAPAFAGLISLLNEERIKAGKAVMGYLNPWIYGNPGAFTDVVLGTNAIGRGTGPIEYGFNCTKGWDPATGLGTPLFDKMLASAMAL